MDAHTNGSSAEATDEIYQALMERATEGWSNPKVASAEPRGGPHDIPRIEGLAEDAVQWGARRLYDPDDMRGTGVLVGERLHAVDTLRLFEREDGDLVKMYEAIGGIRKGAVALPGYRDVFELLAEGRSAPVRMALEKARGRADIERAERFLEEKRPPLKEAR